jgi:hypothetical protein
MGGDAALGGQQVRPHRVADVDDADPRVDEHGQPADIRLDKLSIDHLNSP